MSYMFGENEGFLYVHLLTILRGKMQQLLNMCVKKSYS